MARINRFLPPLIVGFILGIALEIFFGEAGIVGSFVFSGTIFFFANVFHKKSLAIYSLLFALIGCGLGATRMMIHQDTHHPIFTVHEGETIEWDGVISDEPDVRETHTNLTLTISSQGITQSGGEQKVLLVANRYPEYEYGEVIHVKGKVVYPKTFETDEYGREFDYPNYLAKDNIYYVLRYPTINIVSQDGGNVLRRWLFQVKHVFLEHLARVIPEPENALLGGIILGEKSSLGQTLSDAFRASGLVHIIVLSGYNMTIVAQWISSLLSFLGFYPRLAGGAIGILLFAMMAGGGATALRATIMSLLALLARATGRTYLVGRALFFAGFVMLLANPMILLYDPSFQLSFLASIGIIYVTPILEQRWRILLTYPLIREIVYTTVATQLTVFPFLLYQTGMLSLFALPANLLVLPTVPVTMLLGFTTGLLSFLSQALGQLIAFPTYLLLAYQIFIAEHVSSLPLSGIHVSLIPAWFIACVYVFIVALLFHYRVRTKQHDPNP